MTEQTYRRLLRLYPAAFREEFADAMLQHFRDLRGDASQSGRRFSMASFSMRIVADTVFAAIRERFVKTKTEEVSGGVTPTIPSFRFLFLAFLIPLLAGVIVNTASLPRTFMAIARFMVTPNSGSQSYDPYFLQTQIEILQSHSTLETVAIETGVVKKMAERYGIETKSEAATLLRNQIYITQSRNTSLVELRVYSDSADDAELIANRIPQVYQMLSPSVAVTVVDPAQRPLRPVRPNVPLNIVLGTFLSCILAAIASAILRAIVGRTIRRRALR